MKEKVVIFLICIVSLSAQKLSDEAEISLIICDQGNNIYTAFGHFAISVQDSINSIDQVFSYGNMKPGLELVITRPTANLVISTLKLFKQEYTYYQRKLELIKMNLTYIEKISLYKLLLNDKKTKYNKNYDFINENCCTPIIKHLLNILKKQSKKINIIEKKSTFRSIFSLFLKSEQKLIINSLLGLNSEKRTTNLSETCQPINVTKNIVSLFEREVFEKSQTLLQGKELGVLSSIFSNCVFWSCLLFLIVYFFISFMLPDFTKYINLTIYFLIALLGLFLTYITITTEHELFQINHNILWLNPFYLILFIKAIKDKKTYLPYLFLSINLLIILLWVVTGGFLVLETFLVLAVISIKLVFTELYKFKNRYRVDINDVSGILFTIK